jgi:hypothetical protein
MKYMQTHELFLFLGVFLSGIAGAYTVRPGTAMRPAALSGGFANKTENQGFLDRAFTD